MFLVTYAGQDEKPAPVRVPATRHERKWLRTMDPVTRTQAAWVEFNRKGLEIFRKRGMPESIREIVKKVATSRRVAIMLLTSKSRMKIAVEARNEVMYLIKARNSKTSSTQIARWFDRDHTSVLHCIASHQERHNLPKLVGYDIARVRQRNAEISARIRASGASQ